MIDRFVMKNLPVTVTDEEVEAMLRSFFFKDIWKVLYIYIDYFDIRDLTQPQKIHDWLQNWFAPKKLFLILQNPSPPFKKPIYREADKNGDGELDLEEFKIMIGLWVDFDINLGGGHLKRL